LGASGASPVGGAGPGFPLQFLAKRPAFLLRDFRFNPLRGPMAGGILPPVAALWIRTFFPILIRAGFPLILDVSR
jgi:hypothetical protein